MSYELELRSNQSRLNQIAAISACNNPGSISTTTDWENCRAYPIDEIPARTRAGAAIIHMILNNLDSRVAQFPEELVTYGGNGQV